MAHTILDNPSSPVHPEHHVCENCRHWLGYWRNKTFAQIAGQEVWVGQCSGCEENDKAPHADLDNGAEAFVFTPCNGRCQAFEINPDFDADADAMATTYARLDQSLLRDAWAGV